MVRVVGLVAASYFAAAIVGRQGHVAGWWSMFLVLGSLGAVLSAHPSRQLRIASLLFGAVPVLAAAVARDAHPVEHGGPLDVVVLGGVGIVAGILGEMIDGVRVRVARRPGRWALGLGALVLVTVAATAHHAARASEGPALLVERAVVVAPVRLGVDRPTELPGPDVDCESARDGGALCLLDRAHPRAARQYLPRSVELVFSGHRRFLRPVGSADPSRWRVIDAAAMELRRVVPADCPTRPRVPLTARYALGLALLVAALLGVKGLRDLRLRAVILAGVDAMSDGETVETNGHRLTLAVPAGPVVLFGGDLDGGAYRTPPTVHGARWISGTRAGRSLRLLARTSRLPALAALVIALGLLPTLVASWCGATLGL